MDRTKILKYRSFPLNISDGFLKMCTEKKEKNLFCRMFVAVYAALGGKNGNKSSCS